MIGIYNKTQKMKAKATKKLAQYHELRKQRGMSLLEVIIVLGIIGTIAAGVVVLAQRAFDARAVTELVTNTNSVRVAMKDAYQRDGVYPAYVSPLTLTGTTIREDTSGIPVAQLVQLGKLSPEEVRNGISGDFIGIGGALTSASPILKGFAMELNGLSQDQCRSILAQVGSNWEYVEVGTSGSGAYSGLPAAGVDMTVASDGSSVLRSMGADGQESLTAAKLLQTCSATVNSIILSSR